MLVPLNAGPPDSLRSEHIFSDDGGQYLAGLCCCWECNFCWRSKSGTAVLHLIATELGIKSLEVALDQQSRYSTKGQHSSLTMVFGGGARRAPTKKVANSSNNNKLGSTNMWHLFSIHQPKESTTAGKNNRGKATGLLSKDSKKCEGGSSGGYWQSLLKTEAKSSRAT